MRKIQRALLTIAVLSGLSLSTPTPPAAASDPELFHLVVTSVDTDIYLASPDLARYPDARSGQIYLRTDRCRRKSEEEPVVLYLNEENERVCLVFQDEQICEVINASQDRGGI